MRYRCKGRRVTAEQVRTAAEQRLAALTAQLATLTGDARIPIARRAAQLERELAAPVDSGTRRAGCGYDLTAQVQAIPADGDVYEYQCPRCGNTGTMRRVAVDTENAA